MRISEMIKFTLLLAFLCTVSSCGTTRDTRHHATMSSVVRESMDSKIVFYGKVIDQYNEPIIGLDVTLSMEIYNPLAMKNNYLGIKKRTVKTDADGLFGFKGKGGYLTVKFEDLEYYEFKILNNLRTSFSFYSDMKVDPSEYSTEADPFVFHLRKRSKPVFLLTGEFHFRFDPGQKEEKTSYLDRYDFYDEAGNLCNIHSGVTDRGSSNARNSNVRKDPKDILFSGEPLEDDEQDYELTITPLVKNSGILFSDEFHAEAPTEGYQPSVQLQLSIGDDIMEKYLYLKLDNGRAYSVITIRSLEYYGNKISMRLESYTNPSGLRDVEYDTYYQAEEELWRRQVNKMRRKERFPKEIKNLTDAEQRTFQEKEKKFIEKINRMKEEKEKNDKKGPRWWDELEKEQNSKIN